MKKLACLGLALVLLLCFCPSTLATYDGEILFRNIPWDTDIVSVINRIEDEIQIDPYHYPDYILEHSDVEYFNVSDSSFFSNYTFLGENHGYDRNIKVQGNSFIGGWPIEYIDVTAISKVENGHVLQDASQTRIISCSYTFDMGKISDMGLAYQNLKSKLVSLYGNTDKNLEYYGNVGNYDLWLGDSNTYVCLNFSSYGITLKYGITNALELLQEIDQTSYPYDLFSLDGL